MMDHDIVKKDRFHCQVCGRDWKNKPVSRCPGAWKYEWKGAPENLKTRGQLEKMGLKPGGPVRGVVGMAEWPLYDTGEAIPFTLEETEAKREERRKKRYRTCKRCGKEVRREKLDAAFKVCQACMPVVMEERRVKRELERADREREFQAFLIEARDTSIAQARAWLRMGDQAVILDTETTGLDYAEVIEIAIIDLDGQVLVNERVKPKGEISDGAYRVHQISTEMLAECPTWDQVFPRVSEVVKGKKVIVYNAEFDSRVLSYSGQLYQLPELECGWGHCAMKAYAGYYGEWNDYFGSFKRQRLDGGDHSALGDCLATLELIKRMANASKSNEEEWDEEKDNRISTADCRETSD